MTQEFPIFKIKEQLPKIKGILVPVIIIGKITNLKNKIILKSEEYFNFIVSDDSASISLAIKITNETNERINFIKMSYDNKEKIMIKEPRKVNVSQLKNFNVDLLVSNVEPPIGTELLKYSEYRSFKKNKFRSDINLNSNDSINNKSYQNQNLQTSFTTASKILEENSNKIEENEFNPTFTPVSPNQLLDTFQIQNSEISGIIVKNEINFIEKSIDKINYIITTEPKTQNFCSKFTFLVKKNKADEFTKVFEFKLKNEEKYDFLKENISYFTTFEGFKQLLDNLGINK